MFILSGSGLRRRSDIEWIADLIARRLQHPPLPSYEDLLTLAFIARQEWLSADPENRSIQF